MKFLRHIATRFVAVAAMVALAASPCRADSISVTGTFAADNEVLTQMFTVTSLSTVTIESYGYAGGMNAAGAMIASGGFDTILTLFRGDGTFITRNDDGSGVAADPVTGSRYDSKISLSFVVPGTYYVSLTQFENIPSGPFPGDPTSESDPNFTLHFYNSGPSGYFWDSNGTERTGNFAFDIVTNTLPVPEPGSLALLGMGGLGLGLAGLVRRRKRR